MSESIRDFFKAKSFDGNFQYDVHQVLNKSLHSLIDSPAQFIQGQLQPLIRKVCPSDPTPLIFAIALLEHGLIMAVIDADKQLQDIQKRNAAGEVMNSIERRLLNEKRGTCTVAHAGALQALSGWIGIARDAYWRAARPEDRPIVAPICIEITKLLAGAGDDTGIHLFGHFDPFDCEAVTGNINFPQASLFVIELLGTAQAGSKTRGKSVRQLVKAISDSRSKALPPRISPYTVAELAIEFDVPEEALRKRLDRWRKANPGSNDWSEIERKGSRRPRYSYTIEVARPIAQALKEKLQKQRQKTSTKRPSKK